MKQRSIANRFIFLLAIVCVGFLAAFFILSSRIVSYSFAKAAEILTGQLVQLQAQRHLIPGNFLYGGQAYSKEVWDFFFKEIRIPEVKRIKVWDREARVIYSDDPTLIGQQFLDDAALQRALAGKGQSMFSGLMKRENVSEKGYAELIEVYIPITFSGSPDIVGAVEVYYSPNILIAVIDFVRIGGGVLLVATFLLLFLLVLLFFRYQIDKPLLALRDIINVVAAGDLSKRANIKTTNEIGQIAVAVNKMADKIAVSQGELQKEVKIKTATLSRKMNELELEKDKAEQLLDDVRKFQEAVEAVNSHIIFTDPDGIILYANKAATQITGYSLKELVGKRPSLWGNQMPPEFYKNLWNTIKINKQPFSAEIQNRRKSGEAYIADSFIIPILDKSHNVKFFVGVERDITKEKAIDSAKTEFVSVASHQLRTPLSAMKWTTELLLEDKKIPKKERERLLDMETSTERLISLVNNLLNISRIESGKALGAKGVVSLRTIIENALDSLRMAAESRQQKLMLSFGGVVANIFVVSLSFVEAIKIIVSNAINYAPKDTEIKIQISSRDKEYVISVHNDGSYILAEDRPRMFEKFFRGSVAKKTQTEGSGLGLFIAKASIEANGGKIWVESDPKTGTTFYLTVPKFGENP